MRDADVPLQMGTLSKAVGAYGGYLCASQAVIDLMRTRARSFIYSTGLPPPVVAAAIAALDLIERDRALTEEPLRKARLFTRALNLPEAQSAIVPVIVGAAEAALAASEMLENEGFLVVAIRPPTVPAGTARLRFAFTALHPQAEIERLAGIVRTRIIGRHSWARFSSPRPAPTSARPMSPCRLSGICETSAIRSTPSSRSSAD